MKPGSMGAVMMALLICASLPDVASFDLKILHINDHHSHLDEASFTMDTSSLIGGVAKAKIGYGGFPRIVTLMKDLAEQAAPDQHVLKLHAGDAITGTLWHTMFKGRADAEMMGKVCFDAFTLGNHEFDDGDDGLAKFLEALAETGCGTKVLSANLVPGANSPLIGGNQPMKYHVFEFGPLDQEEKVGVIGITTKQHTEDSSYPGRVGGRRGGQDVGTRLLDEVATAQQYINHLVGMGVNKIVLLTHVGLQQDLDLAAQLRGVDVIVGGHSHSLLGDAADLLVAPHALPSDAYPIDPTQTRDKDGHKVCIVQAWQYSRVVGALDVKFNAQGEVTECGGGPKIPLAEPSSWVSASDGALLGADNAATVLAATPSFAFPVTEDEDAASWLEAHRHEIAELQHKVIARFDSNFCHVRIPGTHTDSNGCSTCDTYKRGSAACNFVAQAVLMEEKTADLAIQNGGGCRKDIPHGPYTVGDAFEMLPFDDMVLTVKLTGHEVKQVLEDALTNFLDNGGSTGSYPYAAGLRFEVDLSKTANHRVSNVEVNPRLRQPVWQPMDMHATYTVVTNDYIASGKDGYVTLGSIPSQLKVNTYTSYRDGFMKFLTSKVSCIFAMPFEEYSTQSFENIEGCNHRTSASCVAGLTCAEAGDPCEQRLRCNLDECCLPDDLSSLPAESSPVNRIVATYSLDRTPLVGYAGMNPFLGMEHWSFPVSNWGECDKTPSRDDGTGCLDAPGFGSGITWNSCDQKMYSITDRGPTQDCADLSEWRNEAALHSHGHHSHGHRNGGQHHRGDSHGHHDHAEAHAGEQKPQHSYDDQSHSHHTEGHTHMGHHHHRHAQGHHHPAPPQDTGKAFPLERFAPTVTELSLYKRHLSINKMTPLSYKHVRDHVAGAYATGKGTKDSFVIYEGATRYGGDDAAVTGDCQEPIHPAFDPAGLDSEDVQVLKNGWFIACDEYGKVVVFDSSGVVHVTYVPYGTVGITTANTGSKVKEALPASFALRRSNRGLESIAVNGDKSRAYTCQQSGMDGGASKDHREDMGDGNDVRNSRVLRCAVLDISDPLEAKLVAEKYWFTSPANTFPDSGTSQDQIKVSAAYWLRMDVVMLLERDNGIVRFHEIDFATGDNLLSWPAFSSTRNKFEALRHLEGKTACRNADADPDASCAEACCPEHTCDTAPTCAESSISYEKFYDGYHGPRAMKSRAVTEIVGEADTAKSGRVLGAWEDSFQVDNVFGKGQDICSGLGMRWKIEGFFMINEYHMALINDNDFGLEGNTHSKIVIIQLKDRVELDPCLMTPVCRNGAPTACVVAEAPRPFPFDALPDVDFSMLNCRLEKSWEELSAEYEQDQNVLFTGGLGKLVIEDTMENWLCYRDHECSTDGNYMCWVYHEKEHRWMPWGRNRRLGLFRTQYEDLMLECPYLSDFLANAEGGELAALSTDLQPGCKDEEYRTVCGHENFFSSPFSHTYHHTHDGVPHRHPEGIVTDRCFELAYHKYRSTLPQACPRWAVKEEVTDECKKALFLPCRVCEEFKYSSHDNQCYQTLVASGRTSLLSAMEGFCV